MKKIITTFAITIGLVSTLFGCTNESDQSTTVNKTNSISVTDFANRTITFDHVPKRIVALGNGEIDIIYALGHKVVGRPTGDVIIDDVEDALEVGSTHSIDIEKITSLQPDVVLGSKQMNQKDIQIVESIGAEMVLTNANSVDDIKKQVSLFGQLLKEEEKAENLIEEIDNKVSSLKDLTSADKPKVLLVYGAPGTNMAALPNSLGGELLEIAGGLNIAHDYPSLEMYPQYAQLNTERIIEANPQYILLMTHGNPNEVKENFMKEISQSAGWEKLDAVKHKRVHILPSDLFGTNPGTRVTEALDYLQDLFEEVKE